MIYDGIIASDWYLLSPNEQLLIGALMSYAQNAPALTIGGLSPLNMDTCVKVNYKYSFHFAGRAYFVKIH